ncbi:MAG: MBL fold metallo-hydrolase [Planctomycetota bacterium]|jgi:glyoxylase-like metal-dependent hydrolase (beta-lactamase superfamily II)
MKIDHLVLGDYQTNCYILRDSASADACLIIDTGLDPDPLLDFLAEHKLNPVALILTHGHADHTAAIPILRKSYPEIKVYIHKFDAEMLTDRGNNLASLAGVSFSTAPAEVMLTEGQTIDLAGISLKVLHTPGHTPGGVCLYNKDNTIVFVGDTLFAGSVGRTDFPGGNMPQLIEGIRQKLLSLPDDTICYPGHGPVTTIGEERNNNPFLK